MSAKDRAVPAEKPVESVIPTLRDLNEKFYWMCFKAGVGSTAHSFIEFNGVMSKYIDLLVHAEKAGIDLQTLNEHNGVAMKVEEHDMRYLAEKLRCIFGPVLASNPKARKVFLEALVGEDR